MREDEGGDEGRKQKKHLEENDNGEVLPPVLWDACKAVL